MHLDIFNTHMELYPYTKDDYPWIEDIYTALDKFTQRAFPCGYMIEDGKLYLPRGTPIGKIEQITKVQANYKTKIDPKDKEQTQALTDELMNEIVRLRDEKI